MTLSFLVLETKLTRVTALCMSYLIIEFNLKKLISYLCRFQLYKMLEALTYKATKITHIKYQTNGFLPFDLTTHKAINFMTLCDNTKERDNGGHKREKQS